MGHIELSVIIVFLSLRSKLTSKYSPQIIALEVIFRLLTGIDFHVAVWLGPSSALKILCLEWKELSNQKKVVVRDRVVANISLAFFFLCKFIKDIDLKASVRSSSPFFFFYKKLLKHLRIFLLHPYILAEK